MNKSELIEYHTELVAKNLRYPSIVVQTSTLGTKEGDTIIGIMDAIDRATQFFSSQHDGMQYISETLHFNFESKSDVQLIKVNPEHIKMLTSYYNHMEADEEAEDFIMQLCNEHRPLTEIIYKLNKSKLFSFTDTIWLIEKSVFDIFKFEQEPNKYKALIKQSLIMHIVSTMHKLPIEIFYNETYN